MSQKYVFYGLAIFNFPAKIFEFYIEQIGGNECPVSIAYCGLKYYSSESE